MRMLILGGPSKTGARVWPRGMSRSTPGLIDQLQRQVPDTVAAFMPTSEGWIALQWRSNDPAPRLKKRSTLGWCRSLNEPNLEITCDWFSADAFRIQ